MTLVKKAPSAACVAYLFRTAELCIPHLSPMSLYILFLDGFPNRILGNASLKRKWCRNRGKLDCASKFFRKVKSSKNTINLAFLEICLSEKRLIFPSHTFLKFVAAIKKLRSRLWRKNSRVLLEKNKIKYNAQCRPPFWPSLYQVSQNKTLLKDNTLYTDLNERESREMKTCDEHFHFYDILLCDFETKPTKKH